MLQGGQLPLAPTPELSNHDKPHPHTGYPDKPFLQYVTSGRCFITEKVTQIIFLACSAPEILTSGTFHHVSVAPNWAPRPLLLDPYNTVIHGKRSGHCKAATDQRKF